jgi:ELWxxDGT repeat protein/cysteine-rich repeat protein
MSGRSVFRVTFEEFIEIALVATLLLMPTAALADPVLVKDLGPAPPPDIREQPITNPASLTNAGPLVFVEGQWGFGGSYNTWRSDGTQAGTFWLPPTCPSANPSCIGSVATASGVTYINGEVFFCGGDGKVWTTIDGTADTTVPLPSNAHPADCSGSGFVYVNGAVYFLGNDGGLWKTDGTAGGTAKVADSVDCQYGCELTAGSSLLFFIAWNATNHPGLWKTDGSAAGTVLVTELSALPSKWTAVGDTLFFVMSQIGIPDDLWSSDGTASGTVKISGNSGLAGVNNMVSFQGLLFFTTNDGSWWSSDGTVSGTHHTEGIGPTTFPGKNTLNGFLYHAGVDSKHGLELWRNDLSSFDDDSLFKDINPGKGDSNPRAFTNANGTLYFFANDSLTAEGLWRTDGTVAGTTLVREFPCTAHPCLQTMTDAGSNVVFVAVDTVNGIALWGSDGTAAGTTVLQQAISIANGAGTSVFNGNGTWFFNQGYDLWKTDGTPAGTAFVKTVGGYAVPLSRGPERLPEPFYSAGSLSYFVAQAPTSSTCTLWRTDGTTAGTVQLSNMCADDFFSFGSTVYFFATPGLWKSDGTPAGTVLVEAGHAPSWGLVASNTNAFFIDQINSNSLWKTDGTAAGTVAVPGNYEFVEDFEGDEDLPVGNNMAVAGSRVFFDSNSAGCPGCRYLTVSDGTTAGTGVISGNIGPLLSSVFHGVDMNGVLYFQASGGLWRSDGTAAGTYLVKDISAGNLTNVNGTLFFVYYDSTVSRLWTSDGTSMGTLPVPSSPTNVSPPGDSPWYGTFPLPNANGRVYFPTDDLHIWRSDGTAGGTALIPGLQPGFTLVGPNIFYSKATGNEWNLWTIPHVATCGNGFTDPWEQCDDGNTDNTDGCTNNCMFNVCGDGFVETGVEECDDGNTTDGDCCSATCQLEAPGTTCGTAIPPCGARQCDGAGSCNLVPVNAGVTCRASVGACDIADVCDGVQPLCPVADTVEPSTVLCRPAAGPCDYAAEYCTGTTPTCPADWLLSGTPCGTSANPCDPPSVCLGISADCPAPEPCQTALAEGAQIKVKANPNPAKRLLTWKWKSSGTVTYKALAVPTAGGDTTICVLDQTNVALAATAPADGICGGVSCWAPGFHEFVYTDKDRTADGLKSIVLEIGDNAQFKVKGKGANLPLGDLSLTPPVTVRLLRSNTPICWEATYSSPTANTSEEFKAKSD